MSAHHTPRDLAQTPLNIYWEMTQACGLACRHCRAEADAMPHSDELTHEESLAFLRQIPEFGSPLPQLILTGGDPMARKDLYTLIDEARRLSIGVSITPAAASTLNRETIVSLKEHGVEGLGLSLDGSSADRHDWVRGVPGTFAKTREAMGWAHELGLPFQINTLVCAETLGDIPAIYEVIKPFAPARWSLFFLIAVGRGKVLQPVSSQEAEVLMKWLYQTSLTAPFIVATTEAPSYRRVVSEQEHMSGKARGRNPGFGIRDGHGIVFVSQSGNICPAGFLPLVAGNVKKDRLVEVYRSSDIFSKLHDPDQFDGRCGVCEYRMMCGGSRARAYQATGDPLAEDPLCLYKPVVTSDRPLS